MSEKTTPPQSIPTEPVAPSPQAVQSWDNAQYQQPQNVQYVVMQQSLQGVGGWLAFFVVAFCIQALSYISLFFMALSSFNSSSLSEKVTDVIFSLPIAGLAITTVVLISMQKKVGRLTALITLATGALYTMVTQMVALVAIGGDVAFGMSIIFSSLIGFGLVSVYFVASKRVKATLVK
ncbi:DUF2569 family protein [Candidatus Saccharibacteria bacterium]|nr:DUF2569 family protein [Candidatus Saccharibacteria bacterium]